MKKLFGTNSQLFESFKMKLKVIEAKAIKRCVYMYSKMYDTFKSNLNYN